jgi:sarcosine oxidase subunit gamma
MPVAKIRIQALRSRGLTSAAADPTKLPFAPNTSSGEDPLALWRAPDEWLACSQTLHAKALAEWVGTISSEAPLIVTDASSASTMIELTGPRALDVLMRDCTLDLEGSAVPEGGCGQTLLAQTTVMIHHAHGAADTWHLFVDRSVAMHVWDWLVDTAGPTGADV